MKKCYLPFLFLLFFATPNYAQWEPQGEDLLPEDYSVWSISIVDENVVWVLAAKNAPPWNAKVIKTSDGGQNWEVIDLDFMENFLPLTITAANESVAWLSAGDETTTFKRFIYKTIDGGNSWQVSYEKIANNPNAVWAPAVKFIDENKGFFIDMYGNESGYTEDGGETWSVHSFTYPGGYWGHIDTDHWWDIKGDTIMWASSEKFMRSIDKGENWGTINNISPNYQVHTVQISESGKGLATSDAKLMPFWTIISATILHRTADGGETWTETDTLGFPITSLCYIPGTDGSFMGVSGIWEAITSVPPNYQASTRLTNDGGFTWIKIDTDVRYSTVSFINPETGWAGRVGGADYEGGNPAIFKWVGGDVRDIVTSETDEVLTESVEVFPNPAADYVYINSKEALIEQVEVYSSQGQRIDRLSEGNQNEIDVSRLPAGIYFIHIRLEKGSVVRKVVVE